MPPQTTEVRRAYRRAARVVAPRKKPKKRKCFAVLASWRYQSYQCPSHGMLGGLSEAVAHAVANQFDVDPPTPGGWG